jgi:hypothetical protein
VTEKNGESRNPCRPDLVGFVNSLPLVVVGLKQPGVPARAAFDENLTNDLGRGRNRTSPVCKTTILAMLTGRLKLSRREESPS